MEEIYPPKGFFWTTKILLYNRKGTAVPFFMRWIISENRKKRRYFPVICNYDAKPVFSRQINQTMRKIQLKNCAERHIRPLYVNLEGGDIFFVGLVPSVAQLSSAFH